MSINARELLQLFSRESPAYRAYSKLASSPGPGASERFRRCKQGWDLIQGKIHQAKFMDDRHFLDESFFYVILKTVAGRIIEESGGQGDIDEILVHPLELKNNFIFYSWVEHSTEIKSLIEKFLGKKPISRNEDLFSLLYQSLISIDARQARGEFHTPKVLARAMVDRTFKPGMRALDPSCGTGIFLVEMARKVMQEDKPELERINALARIRGIDVNPLAVLAARVNLLHVHPGLGPAVKEMVLIGDVLSPGIPITPNDLVIGNPPWNVLSGITTLASKEHVKTLAIKHGIKIGGKNSANMDISAVMFYHCGKHLLAPEGTIFLVMSAGIMTGAQHGKFRRLEGYGDVEIWKFEKDVFRIHNICILARKIDKPLFERLKVNVKTFSLRNTDGDDELVEISSKIHVPFNMESLKTNDDLVGRLVPLDEKEKLLPWKKSPYYKDFYRGADIFPRNLFFVDIIGKEDDQLVVIPAKDVASKPPWDFVPFEKTRLPSSCIFEVAKSSDLVPFHLLRTRPAFIPVTLDENDRYAFCLDDPVVASHFSMLSMQYRRKMKKSATIRTLQENMNYKNKLLNPRQAAPIKVVYGGIGSMIKGAILRMKNGKGSSPIADTSLYYHVPGSEGEAYYLLAFLNAPCITRDLAFRGSTGANGSLRNIHKNALHYPIPRYDEKKQEHVDLGNIARKLEREVKEMVKKVAPGKDSSTTKVRSTLVRDYLASNFGSELETLDDLVKRILLEQ